MRHRPRPIISTVMNRMQGFLEPAPEERLGDFWVVAGEFGVVCVTREVAARIERQLDRWVPPRWIVFRDRVGSRVRVRARQVRSVCESTTTQRAADRRLDRAREREEQEDRRPWEWDE